jgi:RNA-directed DNA polymerase
VLLKTDEILTDAADRRDCVYTRYADDLTFSGGDGVVGLLGIATGVLQRIGLELDPRKTNIFRKGRRQCCTGLVVNEKGRPSSTAAY